MCQVKLVEVAHYETQSIEKATVNSNQRLTFKIFP